MIAVNVMIFVTAGLGIWTSDIEAGGLDPSDMLSSLGVGGIIGLLTLVISSVLASIFFNQEKIAGYGIITSVYLATTLMVNTQITPIEEYVGGFPLSAIYLGIVGLIFLSFIIQAIFGGGKQYE